MHLREIGGGKTYAQLRAAAMALPKGSPAYTAAEAKVQTVFQGTTLRGLLLEAYAFGTFGQIALWERSWPSSWPAVMVLLAVRGASPAAGPEKLSSRHECSVAAQPAQQLDAGHRLTPADPARRRTTGPLRARPARASEPPARSLDRAVPLAHYTRGAP